MQLCRHLPLSSTKTIDILFSSQPSCSFNVLDQTSFTATGTNSASNNAGQNKHPTPNNQICSMADNVRSLALMCCCFSFQTFFFVNLIAISLLSSLVMLSFCFKSDCSDWSFSISAFFAFAKINHYCNTNYHHTVNSSIKSYIVHKKCKKAKLKILNSCSVSLPSVSFQQTANLFLYNRRT